MGKSKFTDSERFRAISILTKRIGRQKAIAMPDFYRQVFGEEPKSHVSGTRKIRALITQLREDGEPICSTTSGSGGGYYLASVGSELDDFCERLRSSALRKLVIVSRLKKTPLQNLCTQLELDLQTVGQG